jgi:hypothetical protein
MAAHMLRRRRGATLGGFTIRPLRPHLQLNSCGLPAFVSHRAPHRHPCCHRRPAATSGAAAALIRRWASTEPSYDHFGDTAYWEGFYARRKQDAALSSKFEWFLSSERTVQLVADAVASSSTARPAPAAGDACAVLHVGCGTSTLGLELLQAGVCTSVVNTDTSATAVAEMTAAHTGSGDAADGSGCEWRIDDCTASALPSGMYTVTCSSPLLQFLSLPHLPRQAWVISTFSASNSFVLQPSSTPAWLADLHLIDVVSLAVVVSSDAFDVVVDKGTMDALGFGTVFHYSIA